MPYFVFLILLSACSPPAWKPIDIWPVVVSVYSDRIAPVSPECEIWLEDVGVLVDRPVECDRAGCYLRRGGLSWIWCDQALAICYGHEYLHALRDCETGDADGAHDDPGMWCNYGVLCRNFLGVDTDSVEWRVNLILTGRGSAW